MSDTDRDETGAEERAQMVGLLRHFAEVFGAGEVYREARTILLETVDGARILEEEYGRVRDEALLEHNRQASPYPRNAGSGQEGARKTGGSGRGRGAESALEEARRLLGG